MLDGNPSLFSSPFYFKDLVKFNSANPLCSKWGGGLIRNTERDKARRVVDPRHTSHHTCGAQRERRLSGRAGKPRQQERASPVARQLLCQRVRVC